MHQASNVLAVEACLLVTKSLHPEPLRNGNNVDLLAKFILVLRTEGSNTSSKQTN